MPPRHDDGNLFGHEFGFTFAANARRVNQTKVRALEFKVCVDGVAGGAGDRRDDDALGSRETIDERRLADVRATDDGDADFAARGFAGFGRGQ